MYYKREERELCFFVFLLAQNKEKEKCQLFSVKERRQKRKNDTLKKLKNL